MKSAWHILVAILFVAGCGHDPERSLKPIDLTFMTNIVKTTVACLATLAGPVDAGVGLSASFTIAP